MNEKKVSLIIPVYNEKDNIGELYKRIKKLQDNSIYTFETIFIDDGSTDGSREELLNIAHSDKQVKLVFLTRNYGQTTALAAGIECSNGPVLVAIDADLQNDPADIPALLKLIDEGYDVVSGWRKERKDPLILRRIPSFIANSIISFITGLKLHDFGCTLKAYRREFIENISIHGEMHRFLAAYCFWQGATVTEIAVKHHPRIHGKSKYGLFRTFKVILDLLVVKYMLSYLSKPIYVFGGIAILSFLSGSGVIAFVLIRKIYTNGTWLSPLFFIGFMLWTLGIICFLLGLLAEVLTRLYFETKNNPLYKIKNKINC